MESETVDQLHVDESIIVACRNELARKRQERIDDVRRSLEAIAEKYYTTSGHTQSQHATGYIGLLVQLYDALIDDSQYDAANEVKAVLTDNFIEVNMSGGRSRWGEMKISPHLSFQEEGV